MTESPFIADITRHYHCGGYRIYEYYANIRNLFISQQIDFMGLSDAFFTEDLFPC